MPSPKDILSLKFYMACKQAKLQEARDLVAQGADPLAVIKAKEGGSTFDILGLALLASHSGVIRLILELVGNRIDFSRHMVKYDGSKDEINLLQLAGMACGSDLFREVATCAQNNKFDVKQLLNIPTTSKKQFAIYLMLNFNLPLIINNFQYWSENHNYGKRMDRFLRSWTRNCYTNFSLSDYFTEDETIDIQWSGPYRTLPTLVEYGLDLSKKGEGTLTPLMQAQELDSYSKNVDNWLDLSNDLQQVSTTIKIDRGSYHLEDGVVCFEMVTTNLQNVHPVKFKVILDFNNLIACVKEILAARPNAAMVSMLEKTEQTLRRHSAERAQLQAKLDVVPEVIVFDARPSNPQKAVIYDIVCNGLRVRFEAEALKKTDVFKTNFTGRRARLAGNAGMLLKALASFAPVGSEVLAEAVTAASDVASNRLQRQHDQLTYEKTIGVNLVHLAVAVALALSEHLTNAKDAQAALDKVIKQYNNIDKYRQGDDLVKFLLATVLTPAALQQVNSGSSGTASTNSQAMVAYTGIEEDYAHQGNRAAATRCCVTM